MDYTFNQQSEQGEKKISKLESLKVFLQKRYTSLALATLLLGGSGAAFTTISNNSSSISPTTAIPKNDSLTTKKLFEFGNFLEKQALKKIDRTTTLGRYVRIARYRDHIQQIADKYSIPYEYLFNLIMVESQGNTASINENDGGAGFIHFQPDVAKEYGLRIFTDNKKYKKYSFDILRKKGRSKEKIYKKHGELLQDIINGAGMTQLEKLDERFHITKCIDATAKYLAKIKKNVDKKKNSECSDDSWNRYKNDAKYDFGWMLTLNGFNKGPNRFTVGFEEGSHVNNIKNNLSDMRKYEKYIKDMIQQGKSDQEIFNGLQTTKFI